ncbi:hypothetical protein [Ralstonia solanacearum]|uniref:hypothetical protein n=1 Tax=Ralstonia solanacearum TaxID=305 RepID=UPI00168B1A3D|nr:hypothetical protein [Ralstonia solanacearum]QNT25459.1 hypothetical protein C2I38_25725 [Ralstonia solanacearum]QNT25921.1 hypothetical protein C2I38_027890 [Ralstonia solanacearum]QNT63104.1 hypothetical protein C2L97_25755 [Ralstonia solanacearum]QNT63513.1 hypothetical protein C2L97_27835 [Ralstonia solanacearum]
MIAKGRLISCLIKPVGNDVRFDPVSIMLTTFSYKTADRIISGLEQCLDFRIQWIEWDDALTAYVFDVI